MGLQQKVWLTISWTHCHSFWIIRKVHSAIFYPFEVGCTTMHWIKHPILPLVSSSYSSGPRLLHLKNISVMSVLNKELKMTIGPHVNNYGSIVSDIMMQILKILLSITKFPYFSQDTFVKFNMNGLKFHMHVDNCFNLSVSASLKRRIFLFVKKFISLFASL